MSNPILVNLTRGPLVESCHRGALALVRADGDPVLALGDVDSPIYPRSAIKVLQALPLVESGAAESAGLDDKELALACASHSGEPAHVETARQMLEKSGLDSNALICGAHWPLGAEATRALAASGGTPTALHNNCSGKHAGMLTLSVHLGADVSGYEKPDHPVQQRVRKTIEEMTEEPLTQERCAVDGCSLPTWATSLSAFARAFARLASSAGLSPARNAAAQRLMRACINEPTMVEGTGRFGTGVMRRLGSSAFVKGGAEGVYCAAFPEHGLGLAMKIDDGARRGSEAVAAHVIASLFPNRISGADELLDLKLTNWRNVHVGDIRPAPELRDALARLRDLVHGG